MKDKMKATHRSSLEVVSVPIKYEIVTFEEDTIEVGENGVSSLGSELDKLIDHTIEYGGRLGKVTYDLTELTDRYALPEHVVKENRERAGRGGSL